MGLKRNICYSSIGILLTPITLLLIMSIAFGELVVVILSMSIDSVWPMVYKAEVGSFWCRKRHST